jgi:RNA polymerase-binding protein DksA
MPTKELKNLLLKEKERILKSLGKMEENTQTNMRGSAADTAGVPTHIAELGSDAFEKDLEINLTSSESDILQLIEGALRKIENKKFGRCESCSKPIPMKRLKAIPYTRYCIECQKKAEKSNGE